MPRRFSALLLLALCSCAVDLTAQDAIWFEPAGHLWTEGVLVFSVGSRGVSEGDLLVDGSYRGRWRSGAGVRLKMDPGEHRLEARGSGFKGPVSTSVDVSVALLSIVSITPPLGKVPVGTPPEFTIQFSAPVSRALVETSRLAQHSPDTTLADLPHVWIDDQTVRFQVAGGFGLAAGVNLDLRAGPRGGEPRAFGTLAWAELAADISFVEVATAGPPCAGVHRWTVTPSGDVPPSGTVTCGGGTVATVSGPAPWTIDVDLDALPEGTCELGFDAPGTRINVLQNFPGPFQPALTVDRTRPRLIAVDVSPLTTRAGQLGNFPAISLRFPEYVNGIASVSFNGVPVAIYGTGVEFRVPTITYGRIEIGPGTLSDLCQNPVEPFNEVLEYGKWFAPYGAGPLLGGVKVAAGAAWLEDNPLQATPYGRVPDGYVAWIPAPGEPAEGSLQVSVVSGGNTFRSQLSSGVSVSGFDLSDAVIAWREPTSATLIKLAFWDMVGLQWIRPSVPSSRVDAAPPSVRFTWFSPVSPGPALHTGGDIQLTWTEPDSVGGQAGMLARGTTSGMGPGLPKTPAAPGATLRSFRYVDCGMSSASTAWLQDDGTGPRVHAVGYNANTAFDGPIDLVGPSSGLSLTCSRALWSEGGRVYVSNLDSVAGAWGLPVEVQIPAGSTADSPTWFSLGGVAMVVRTPSADEIRIVYIGPDGTQSLWSDVVNQGVAGRVRSLTVSGWTFSWVDDTGQLWARTFNF